MKNIRLQALCGLASVVFYLFFPHLALSADADFWQIMGLSISSNDKEVQLKVDSLRWSDYELLQNIDYRCADELLVYPSHNCADAQLSFYYGPQLYLTQVDSEFDFFNQDWRIDLTTAEQQLGVELNSGISAATIKINQLNITDITTTLLPNNQLSAIPEGVLDGQFLFDYESLKIYSLNSMDFTGFNYEYSDDVIVAELSGQISFKLDIRQQVAEFEISIDSGEMLINEVYADFSTYPVTLKTQINLNETGWYDVSAELVNQQSLTLNAQFSVNNDLDWSEPEITALVTDSHHFNQQILASVLGIYGFGKSSMSGQFEINMLSDEQNFDQWRINFNDYYFLNETRKISAEALDGEINWHQFKSNDDSKLHWQSLLLAGLPIETAQVDFNVSQDQLLLNGEHQFPVFDGAIQLQELAVGALFSEAVDMNLNASILPISLKLITERMGWPIMSGSISGDIPGMIKQGNVINFLGALDLNVFEGEMLIENLSLERLFGVAPVIAADISFNGFDLSLLTETFGFGLITGKMSGAISELRITNWKTDRLDAEVYTVKTKGIKQIISQRAIENISSLGGIKGAISKTFLRFFDDFRYKNIKLSCKLHNSVCEIGGLKNQGNQFVIVEGGGIPKINIVGFVRSINWEEFVRRLLNANYDN